MKVLKAITAVAIINLAVAAKADQFKTVEKKTSIPKLTVELSYPLFFEKAFPGAKAINKAIQDYYDREACAPEEIPADKTGSYYSTITVVALNKRYVGISISHDRYCNQAYPDSGITYKTFSAQTGEELKLAPEFGMQDIDDPNYDENANKEKMEAIGRILLNKLGYQSPTEEDECFVGNTPEEKLERMVEMNPQVAGLAKDKQIVLSNEPVHAQMSCYTSFRVNYDEIKDLLTPTSYLHKWLQPKK